MREFYKESNKEIKNEENETIALREVKIVDKCFVYLLVSLMDSINPVINENNATNYSQECLTHPFFTDDEYTRNISDLLSKNINGNNDNEMKEYEMKNIVQNFDQVIFLAWIISLQKVSHLKQEKCINSCQMTTNFGDYDDILDCDQSKLESRNLYEIFSFLTVITGIEEFHEQNIWIKCFHDLVTDFIIYMPKMLKDLKTESLRTASNVTHFSSLMGLIGNVHGPPERLFESSIPFNNEYLESLTLEFWAPQDMTGTDLSASLISAGNYKNLPIKSNCSYRQSMLFKFIRDCGDLIDNPEFLLNFLFMLKGLCINERVAVYIYNMFNSNLIGHHNKLSWEYFSTCMLHHAKFYHSNPHRNQVMDPMELAGLLVVLQLIRQVTKMSPKVCEMMVNNDSLMIVQNLVLLLSCGVPKSLKAELFNCLAVFCHNALVAKSIWQALESNKIIGNSHEIHSCSIQIELGENEPKLEEFDITRAFLNFLLAIAPHILCDISYLDQSMLSYDKLNVSIISAPSHHAVVENLTSVVQLMMENVFLKHSMRTYRNIEEKFAICESFLKLSSKCVELFLAQSGNTKNSKSKISWCQYDPGFYIINQLLSESPFFKTIVSIIENGFLQINETLNNVTFGQKTFSERTVELLGNSIYLAMDLVSTVLKHESFLVELNTKFNSQYKIDNYRSNIRSVKSRNVIPQELSQLLITTGGSQSFLPNLIKYISIADENEKIARKALTIFNYCIEIVQPHSNLMLLLTNQNAVDVDILPLMVNCIDKYGDIDSTFVDCVERGKISQLFFNDYVSHSPRTLVLKILINCLQQPTPNLGQYLMGFSCASTFSVKRTSLQEAGVGDFPKTCLHSLLNLIQRLVTGIVSNPLLKDNDIPVECLPELAADMIDICLGYRILYLLASNSFTSMAVLRFIRSNYQFIFKQIDLLAFTTARLNNPELRAIAWNQKSWLLKIIAIEIRLCTANQQRSYISKLLKLLFGEDLYSSNSNSFLSWLSDEEAVCQGLIYVILEDFDITDSEDFVDFSICQRLKPEVLKEYLNDCIEETYMGIQLIDGNKFKQIIFADINMVGDEEQFQMLQFEVDNVCHLIDRYNTNNIWLKFGKSAATDAWSQVIEVVMLSECSGEDSVQIEIKKKKIYEILHLIYQKMLIPSTPSCLVSPFSRVSLILSAVLAGTFICNQTQSNFLSQLMPSDEMRNSEEKRLETIDIESLCNQLRILIKLTTRCIMEINFKYQNIRIKFYGALTYLLEIVLAISKFNPNFSSLLNECYLTINNHSLLLEKISENSLYSTVCCDCISGNFHLSLSALTLLDCIATLDNDNGGLIGYLNSQGYLKHFIVSLIRDCDNLYINMKQHCYGTNYIQADSSNTNAIYSYYLYQSRLSLLCKLATQPSGAKALVQCGALSSLSRCEIFKMKPPLIGGESISHNIMDTDDEGDIDDIRVQYKTVISLAIQFANNILSASGLDKTDAIREVLIFIGESIDCFIEPFHSPSNASNSISIKEMIQISNLFVILVPAILNSKSLIELEYKYRSLEKMKRAGSMVMSVILELLTNPIMHNEHEMMLHFLHIQLMGNCLSIAAGFVAPYAAAAGGGGAHGAAPGAADGPDAFNRVFFSPVIDESIGGKNSWNCALRRISQAVRSGNKPPFSLAVIILFKLQECFEMASKKLSVFDVMQDLPAGTAAGAASAGLLDGKGRRKLLRSAGEIEEKLMRMSTDQLQLLWNSVFDSVPRITDDSPIIALPDQVNDLVIVYKRITCVISSLKDSLESCCFLIWYHALAYNNNSSTSADKDNYMITADSSLHPIQRLHKIQQIKMEFDQPKSVKQSNNDIIFLLSKCIDDDLLYKIQSAFEIYSDENESSFLRILVHRLMRILKLV